MDSGSPIPRAKCLDPCNPSSGRCRSQAHRTQHTAAAAAAAEAAAGSFMCNLRPLLERSTKNPSGVGGRGFDLGAIGSRSRRRGAPSFGSDCFAIRPAKKPLSEVRWGGLAGGWPKRAKDTRCLLLLAGLLGFSRLVGCCVGVVRRSRVFSERGPRFDGRPPHHHRPNRGGGTLLSFALDATHTPPKAPGIRGASLDDMS